MTFRPTWSLLGIPVQPISAEATLAQIYVAARENRRLFLSTSNVNFLITSNRSREFTQSLLLSDINVIDGAPLVWLGRWLGVPIPERVAGATLLETLAKAASATGTTEPLQLFLFGGEGDTAQRACANINAETLSNTACIGSLNPGFGNIDSLSTPSTLDTINASGADFLVVSLGAEKGQAWITRNLMHLKSPVVSHLGAALNFLAGDVSRAPRWLQAVGCEWLWRIKEQPHLVARYWHDGLQLLKLIFCQAIPYRMWLYNQRQRATDPLHYQLLETAGNACTMKLQGALSEHTASAVDDVLLVGAYKSVTLDLEGITFMDARGLGWLLAAEAAALKNQTQMCISVCSPAVCRILSWNNMLRLLNRPSKNSRT